MDYASIQIIGKVISEIIGKVISEQDGISLFNPLFANGPLLGHLFDFKYFDKITLMYMIKLL